MQNNLINYYLSLTFSTKPCDDSPFLVEIYMEITIIAVAGASGSGKTTIAKQLQEYYGSETCTIISSDNYYKDLSHLTAEERAEVNFDHPDSIDFERLARDLTLLKQGQTVEIPTYDFTTHSRTAQTHKISPKPVIILEGILILHPECLTLLYDTKIFVNTDLDICLMRPIERDGRERDRTPQQVLEQYKRDVRPMFKEYVEPCKKRADILVKNSETCENLRFDMTPLGELLSSKSKKRHLDESLESPQQRTKKNAQAKCRLFSKSQDSTSSSAVAGVSFSLNG